MLRILFRLMALWSTLITLLSRQVYWQMTDNPQGFLPFTGFSHWVYRNGFFRIYPGLFIPTLLLPYVLILAGRCTTIFLWFFQCFVFEFHRHYRSFEQSPQSVFKFVTGRCIRIPIVIRCLLIVSCCCTQREWLSPRPVLYLYKFVRTYIYHCLPYSSCLRNPSSRLARYHTITPAPLCEDLWVTHERGIRRPSYVEV
jgi:hypothetical protein